jgi:ABC-2 type transport system permease protein
MNSFRNIGAIIDKEWKHYFGSPIAYVVLFVWTLLFGLFFVLMFNRFIVVSNPSAGMEMGAPSKMSLNQWVFEGVFHNMCVVALSLTPMLTMRLFAEEKRQGTMELLGTCPITSLEIVLGKFLAALGVFGLMLLTSLLNFALVWYYAPTKPEWKPILTGSLALLLIGGCFIAVGTFVSTLTKNQIVASAVTFGALLGLWLLGWMDDPSAGPLSRALAYLGLVSHIEDLIRGVIDLKDIVFYLSFITFGLFLAHEAVESQRWRA